MIKQDSPELTAHCPLKRRRKHPEGSVQTLSKPESPGERNNCAKFQLDPRMGVGEITCSNYLPDRQNLLAEQLNQSSAARILQELPRYNWLEQKILQKNYTPVSGVVNLSTGQAQESSRSGSSKSQLSVATSSRPSTKSRPKIAGESQELSLAETQKDVQPGRLATNSKLQEEMDTRGAHLPQSELAEITKCNERDMATLTEMPSSLTSEALAGISEMNTSQLCPPSPDDTNEESGLTIDLGHEDEADSSARDAMSPAAEVDAEITEAHTSSTDSLLERVTDEITNSGSGDHGTTVFQTSVKLSPPQLDLSFHTSEEDGRAETTPDRETIKVESSEMSGSSTQLSTNSSSALTTSTTTSASPFSATDMSPGGYSLPGLSSSSVATNSAAPSVQKQGGMTVPEVDEANLPQATTAPSASATGHASSKFGVAIRTNTTTTSTTTTSSSLVVTCPAPAVDNSALPLDLCLKKTESLATTNSRVKGHPPVQMVLPQIQHKTLTSPHLVPTSPAIPDIKTGKTSVSSVSQELDSKPMDNIGDDILSSKSHQRASLGSEFKVEATYPLHTDTLDLCIKTSNGIKSLSSNPDTSAHLADGSGDGSTIDERITIGLALSAELETEADRASKAKSLDMEASIRTLVQANVTDVGTSLKPDLLDLPLSLSTSYQDMSKTMTDAELDQEFQKHLIEFKALEKLAERKAQEQMQVAIMRKRKAAMLRIMEMKKAKRDFDRVGGQLSSFPHENDRPSVATSKILSNISPNNFVASTTSTVPTLTSTSTSVMKPSLSNLEGHSSTVTLSESASKAQTLLDPPLSETSEKITDSETADVSSQSSDSLDTSQIKTEVMDCDSEITSPGLKVECKLEIMEVGCDEPNETSNESHTNELNPSESKSNTESAICLGTTVEGEKAVDTKQSKEHKDTEKTSAKTANVLTPTPAHQSQPQIALLDMQDSPVTTAYILGPYHRRSVQINEPPFIGKDIQKNDQPQRAHNQRPFQTAGNLIVPNSGTFSLPSSGSPNTSSNSKQRQESAHAIKPGINQNSKLDKPLTQPLQKSSSGPPSLNDGSNPQRCTDLITLRNQRKSLDDSDLRNQVRVASKTILDSGPKSADQVNKTYQPFHPGSSSAEKRVPIKSSEAITHTLQQHQLPTRLQPLPSSQIQSSLRPNERPTFFMEDGSDKKSAFKAHVRPQNNLVIDLTRDSRPASGELSLSAHSQQGQVQQTSPMDDRLHYSRQDSTGRRNHVALPNTGARINPSVDDMSSAIFHEFQTGLDKTNSLPNGFNTDRSRPGGFLTNQHQPPVRLERPIPVKDTVYMRDQIRPTMSTVTQHRQRYLDTSSAPEQHLNVASQSVMNKNYHKGSEELSPSYMPSSHMIAPTSAWGEDQHHSGADFNSTHASPAWRGHSPLAAASRHMEMYGDMDNIGNRMLAEDMDKQRNRADIHSAFQKHADMAYKQKQLDAGLGYRAPALNPGLHHTLQHPSLHPSAVPLHHQPPIMLQSFQARPSLPDPPTSISESYMRQQGQSQQSQQHQQQKVRALPPLDGTQPSWKTYGSVDCTMTSSALQQRAPYAPNQPLNPSMSGIQDPMAYQKLQHHQQQQQQQILQHQQQYQFQQMQGRSAQKIIPTNQGSSPTGQRMPLPQSHPTQSLAIPQLMFSECSNTPNYPNISPNSPQAPGMILSQNQNIHHRPGEAEHLNIMRQRQFSKQHTVFDQRPRPQVPQSMAPPPSQTQSMLQSKPTTMSPMSGAARPAPVYTSIGQTINHPPSITNSLCRVCGNVAVYLCSSCRRVWYCNLHCQTKDWGVHATECKPAT